MLYDLGFFIFSLFYMPALIFKGKLHGEFSERFGIYDKAKQRALFSGKDRIWIQAVSVGEVALCRSLIPLLKEKFPSTDIVISTITKAGNELARKIFGKDAIIIYFPLDFSFVVRKVAGIIKPALYIMVETEIWPNLLKELERKSVPCVLINGRISDRSIGKYRLAKLFLKNTFGRIRVFCMQDPVAADRIIELGAPRERVRVTGNMKFDVDFKSKSRNYEFVRRSFGLQRDEDLLVAGSTHEGEEEVILASYKELSSEFLNLKLLIAPRHIERVKSIEKMIRRSGLEPVRVSQFSSPANVRTCGQRILVMDTIGHLNEAYSVATIVFIGGSLVEYGGHNPIEPAVFGKAIIFGPHMFNFRYIADLFLKNRGAIRVSGKEELCEKCTFLLTDVNARRIMGENAERILSENSGATRKNIEAISGILR